MIESAVSVHSLIYQRSFWQKGDMTTISFCLKKKTWSNPELFKRHSSFFSSKYFTNGSLAEDSKFSEKKLCRSLQSPDIFLMKALREYWSGQNLSKN